MKLITDLKLEKILKSMNIKYEVNLTNEGVIPRLKLTQISLSRIRRIIREENEYGIFY